MVAVLFVEIPNPTWVPHVEVINVTGHSHTKILKRECFETVDSVEFRLKNPLVKLIQVNFLKFVRVGSRLAADILMIPKDLTIKDRRLSFVDQCLIQVIWSNNAPPTS